MDILLATDANWIVEEVTAALGSPDIGFVVTTEGREVAKIAADRDIGVAILDSQIGSMGGMAASMDLRLDESNGSIGHVPILVLLDRPSDAHLAERCGADGWITKPLDALRLKRAVATVANGESYRNGVPITPVADTSAEEAPGDDPGDDDSSESGADTAEAESVSAN